MHYFTVVLRLLLLLFALYGFAQVLRNRISLKTEFLLPIIFSGIGLVMFVAGILNILSLAAWGIVAFGVLCGIWSLIRHYSVFPLITPGTVILTVVLAVLLVLTVGNKFTHYDNFSHWGLVVRQIVQTDAFPNFDDTHIMFQSYPLGSASFIYFFAKISGIRSEWFYLFSQQVLTVSMLCSVFAFFRSRKILTVLSGTASVLLILFANMEFSVTHDLLVDILLPSIAVAAFALAVHYRKDLAKYAWVLLPLAAYPMAVKNSGVLFCAAILLYYIYRTLCNLQFRKLISLPSLALCAAPPLTRVLWNSHVSYVFPGADTSKHAVSSEYYEEIYQAKTPEIKAQISESFLSRVFSPENTFYLVVIILTVCLLLLLLNRKKSPAALEVSVIIGVCFTAWMVGTYFVYLLSMPNDEALNLDGYFRYLQTGLVFCFGMVLIVLGELNEKISLPRPFGTLVVAAVSLGICLGGSFALKSDITKHDGPLYSPQMRDTFDAAMDQGNLPRGGDTDVFVLWQDGGYPYFLAHYALNTTGNVGYCGYSQLEQYASQIESYDYLFVPEHNEITDKFLTETFGTADRNVYQIKGE